MLFQLSHGAPLNEIVSKFRMQMNSMLKKQKVLMCSGKRNKIVTVALEDSPEVLALGALLLGIVDSVEQFKEHGVL